MHALSLWDGATAVEISREVCLFYTMIWAVARVCRLSDKSILFLWNHIVKSHCACVVFICGWNLTSCKNLENHSITSIGFFLFFFVSDQNLTLEELLKQHTTRVLSPSSQRITVRRSHILDDAVGALRCGFVETKRITIHFLGESAIDEGGPRREFFMLLMGCIANNSSILIGPPGSRVLRHNTSAFQVLV